MSNVLVLNMGMKSIRSIIFDVKGNKLASSACPLTTALNDEQVTQDPDEWWDKACQVIKDTLDYVPAQEIDFITVTSSAACILAVDKDMNCLSPCIMVSDRRATEECNALSSCNAYADLYNRTELKMDAHMMLPKMLWIKRNWEKIYKNTFRFLSPNDYLLAKLTGGCCVTDYINAAKWHYDKKKQTYPHDLMREIGLDEKKLPDVVEPGKCIGNIDSSVDKQTGLSQRTKVVVSTYDAICSFIGSGAVYEGEACDISGTVTVLRTVADKDKVVPVDGVQMQAFHEIGLHILGGSNNMGGGLIEWVKQCYYQNESLPYELMEKDAREAGLGAGGLIFLPYLLGERMPIWDSEARGVFFGLERTHTRKEMTRAVFESTGFIDLDMIGAIEKSGGSVERIRLSGGLSRVALVSQIKADITGREIHVLEEFETTAAGAAMIVLLTAGEFASLEEVAKVFANVRMIIKPNIAAHQKYLELYGLYKDTYMTLKELFPRRTELINRIIVEKKIRIENL